ncbi:sigma-70 family RNA polymerase sigma factor [Streptomyces sp. GC420]|uniref:sigma-70 family RNA polymerase sigma factor n=1 Tax=Streptomyces sp. GC420 TaxID=2697568 RepID=UPI00141525ED|nr:sigma-70 family RNA polymerase sigma factor [Streptomyces sp. GC420]NBM18042.1 sigma-70 family RNA polymerase sigma factor [Streptomyces sp. GC420]
MAVHHITTPLRTDERALARLQEEHGRALFGFLLGLTYGDRQRAEDLVQETLVRAWQHPEALQTDHDSMRPWLFTVGRRLAIDARRARCSRPNEVDDQLIENSVPPEDPADRSVESLDVRRALRGLSPGHRAVLMEVYFRGQSVTEAAETLGIPPGTVKSRTYYALRALRQALPGYGYAEAAEG